MILYQEQGRLRVPTPQLRQAQPAPRVTLEPPGQRGLSVRRSSVGGGWSWKWVVWGTLLLRKYRLGMVIAAATKSERRRERLEAEERGQRLARGGVAGAFWARMAL